MARKQVTKGRLAKPAGDGAKKAAPAKTATAKTGAAKSTAAKSTAAKRTAAKSAAGKAGAKAPKVTAVPTLPSAAAFVRPAKALSNAAREAVRKPVAALTTKGRKSKPKTASRRSRSTPLGFLSDLHAPSLPGHLGDTMRGIGTQIAGALDTPVGRAMVAELLVYVAKSLTKAASETGTAETAKAAILGAGARVGAAAADAGARFAATGRGAAAAGGRAASAGASAAGKAADSASELVREVAQVAVGAVGGMVMDAAQRALSGRRGPGKKAAGKKGTAQAASRAPDSDPGDESTAPAFAADAGHKPPRI